MVGLKGGGLRVWGGNLKKGFNMCWHYIESFKNKIDNGTFYNCIFVLIFDKGIAHPEVNETSISFVKEEFSGKTDSNRMSPK